MEIQPISGSLPPTPPALIKPTVDRVNLNAIRTGNIDADHIDPAEFGGPESDKSILRQLSLIQQDSQSSSPRLLEKLRDLQQLKKSENPEDRLDAIKEFGRLGTYRNEQARAIGTAGLINAIYTSLNQIELHQAISLLLLILDSKATLTPYEFQLATLNIFQAFSRILEKLNPQTIQDILKFIEKFNTKKTPDAQPYIAEFVEKATENLAKSASKPPTFIDPKPTISQVIAAETSKNIVPTIQKKEDLHLDQKNIDALLGVINQLQHISTAVTLPLLAESVDLIVLVLYITSIGKRIKSQRRKAQKMITALVTHPSATIPDTFLQKMPVYIVDYDPENYIRIFHDKFLSLQSSGFTTVFALLPHSDFWHSYHHARHALTRPTANIVVIDTKLYGLALGLLVKEVASRMGKLQRRTDIETLIKKMSPLIHYVVLPAHAKAVNGHFWYQKMKRKSVWKTQMQTTSNLPIIGFGENAGIISTASTITNGILKLEAMVTEQYHRNQAPRVIIIEHNNMLPIATSVEAYFKQTFPTAKISIQPSSDFLASVFGEFIGIVSI